MVLNIKTDILIHDSNKYRVTSGIDRMLINIILRYT